MNIECPNCHRTSLEPLVETIYIPLEVLAAHDLPEDAYVCLECLFHLQDEALK